MTPTRTAETQEAGFESIRNVMMKEARLRAADLSAVPITPGLYVIWFHGSEEVCLKVGIAGPRRRDGLRGRLKLHFASNPSNSVLARHMIADATPAWAARYDFRVRADRRVFLNTRCSFAALELTGTTELSLRALERRFEAAFRPRYIGRVGEPYDS